MASETDTDVQCVGKNIPRTQRKLQKHLRSSGLAYVSRTGKIIPAKQVSEELCQCPQKCNDRVSYVHRERLFTYFYQTLGDADEQNKFLRNHMDVRPRLHLPPISDIPRLPGTRPPRRITCKYLMPLLPAILENDIDDYDDSDFDTLDICQKAFCSAFVISTKRVRLQREKLIQSMGLNSYHHQRNQKKKTAPSDPGGKSGGLMNTLSLEMDINRVDNDNEAMEVIPNHNNNNNINVTKKKSFVDDPLIPLGISVPEGVTIAPVTATPDHDRDIAIVNNFFSNQLWKPEYIGTYS